MVDCYNLEYLTCLLLILIWEARINFQKSYADHDVIANLEHELFHQSCDKFYLPTTKNRTRRMNYQIRQLENPVYVYKTLPEKTLKTVEITVNISRPFINQIFEINRDFCTSFILFGDQNVDMVRCDQMYL